MREFNVSTGGATTTNAALVFVNPKGAPNPNIEFLRWWVGQTANATSAQQRVQIVIQGTNFPTLTAATPAKLKPSDPNASIIVGSNNGAIGTAGVASTTDNNGTQSQIWDDAFNVLNGWLHVPTPAETIVGPAGLGSGVSMRFPVAPAAANNWSMGCIFREV